MDDEPIGDELHVGYIERDDLRASEAAREPQKEQRAITDPKRVTRERAKHRPDMLRQHRTLLDLSRADAAPDAFHGFAHDGRGSRRRMPRHLVGLTDGDDHVLDGRHLLADLGHARDEGRDRLGGRWERR